MDVRDSGGQPEDTGTSLGGPDGDAGGRAGSYGPSPRPDAGLWNERIEPPTEPLRGDATAFVTYGVLGPAGPVLGVPTWTPTPAVPFPRPAPVRETDPPTLA